MPKKSIDLKTLGFTPFPLAYELCEVVDKDGRRQFGWWDGKEWIFGRKRIVGEPIGWKKTSESMG